MYNLCWQTNCKYMSGNGSCVLTACVYPNLTHEKCIQSVDLKKKILQC